MGIILTVWHLFIDDERDPPRDGRDWVVVRGRDQMIFELAERECFPVFISFDHDLGEGELSGHELAKLLVDMDMDSSFPEYSLPKNFDFYVHSQNPVGKANIESYLNNYIQFKKQNK